MKSPLVSVLIPCYNHEKYVQECIKSIIDQDYQNIELIIIDDGSVDNSFEKVLEMKDECEKRFSNFKCLRQENSGTCVTFNRLFENSKGEYIYFIASDDVSMPTAITKQIQNFDEETVVVVGDNAIIDSNSSLVGWDDERNCVSLESCVYNSFMSYLKKKSFVLDDTMQNFGSYASLCKGNYIPNGQLIKRSAFLETGGYNINAPLEDLYLNLQLSKIGKIKYIDDVLFKYRWHETNTVKNIEKMYNYNFKTLLYEKESLLKKDDNIHLEIFEKNNKSLFVDSFYHYFDLIVRNKKNNAENIYFLEKSYENISKHTIKQKIFFLIAKNVFFTKFFRYCKSL